MSIARKIASRSIDIIDIRRPFSNFTFCENKFDDLPTIKRILSLSRTHKCKTMVIENIPLSDELIRENNDLKKIETVSFKKGNAFRVSFFNKLLPSISPEQINLFEDQNFIGYAIIKENIFKDNSKKYITFESVLKPSPYSYSFIPTVNTFVVRVGGKEFKVSGSVFSQQNTLTNQCAHSALRTVLSSAKYDVIVPPHVINDILNITPKSPSDSELFDNHIKEVLKYKGFDYFEYKIDKSIKHRIKKLVSFPKYLYASIESCYTGLLGFSLKSDGHKGENHLVPVVGHTFNPDMWVPNADQLYFKSGKMRYVPSESWAGSLIIHDDNCGSYYSLPLKYLNTNNLKFCLGTKLKKYKSDPIEIELLKTV